MSERTKEIGQKLYTRWVEFNGGTHDFFSGLNHDSVPFLLDALPEFQPAKTEQWIKCSEQTPPPTFRTIGDAVIWVFAPNSAKYPAIVYAASFNGYEFQAINQNIPWRDVTHWMPRYVPEPPKEEESELVKQLKSKQSEYKFGDLYETGAHNALHKAIEIVKKYESKVK